MDAESGNLIEITVFDGKTVAQETFRSSAFKQVSLRVQMALRQGRKEIFYLTTHLTDYIYGCMASDVW